MAKPILTVVIPTLNEADNIKPLIERIDTTLNKANIPYHAIVVDDHSTDDTRKIANRLTADYPIVVVRKRGAQGKAQALLQGFSLVKTKLVCMIDADLQYPPEAIPEMVSQITANKADVVVADRKEQRTSHIRQLASRSFRTVFGQWLHGLTCDVQSGLKVFKHAILDEVKLDPTPWTFDLEFLTQARQAGYRISSIPVIFAPRIAGQAKINLLKSSWEIGSSAIKVKLKQSLADQPNSNPKRAHTQKAPAKTSTATTPKIKTYNQLDDQKSALTTFTFRQKLFGGFIVGVITASVIINWRATIILGVTVLTFAYFVDLLFNFFLIIRSFFNQGEIQIDPIELEQRTSPWPKYTILCPLYKETSVIPQFTQAMSELDYPKDKLEVLLLLEEDDKETIRVAEEMGLPEYFQIIVVPDSQPKTKPKACNYGLLQSTGKYVVIYDAEDIPEPEQLKKAVTAFEISDPDIICIQSKLNYYNSNQNLLTRLFTAEYSLWFDLVLTGLHSIQAPIPLGGTSNHFRLADLKKLGAWDPFNVTEDADLGMRIIKNNGRTAVLDSTTQEEANSQVNNWLKQRTRWIKGYMQTYLVHMRRPSEFFNTNSQLLSRNQSRIQTSPIQKLINFLAFQFTIGGKISSMIINPFLWVMTILYFTFRSTIGDFIDSLYLTPILYLGGLSLFIGNSLYIYYYLLGLAKRHQWELIPYALLVPVYWLGMSLAAMRAVWELITKPHYWYKTVHGLHLNNANNQSQSVASRLKPAVQPIANQ